MLLNLILIGMRFFILALLVALWSCDRAPSSQVGTELVHLQAAKDHFDNQRFFQAINELERAIVVNPENPIAHKHLVWLYTKAGDYELAEHHYHIANGLAPNDPQLLFSWAMLLKITQRFPEAEQIFTQVIALNPNHLVAQNHLGHVFASQGKTTLAIDQLNQVLTHDPSNRDARFLLGQEYARSRQPSKALEHLNAVAGATGTNTAVQLRALAAVYTELRDFNLAKDNLERALGQALKTTNLSLALAIERDLHDLPQDPAKEE